MARCCFHPTIVSFGFSIIVVLCFVEMVSGQIETYTPPPRTSDNKPIESNGIIYYLDYIPKRCQNPYVRTFPFGGIVDRPVALVKRQSPHRIGKSIEISPKGCLFIEPGCKLEFAPGEGIIVNGTLIARGSEEPGGRIIFTKDPNAKVKPTDTWRNDARLVDGNSTMDGRLELFYQNKWRGVCTNYINFTEAEANITCRHLGFRNGNFTYHSFSWNLTDYLLFEQPRCAGQENSLTECPGWLNIKIGPHVCDGQQTIGFECEGLRSGLALDHWRGIEFYNSSTEEFIDDRTSTKLVASDSSIWYADIEYAGLDTFREGSIGIYHPYASLSASPYVPNLDNVTIQYGAYDALNFTYILGNITVQNCTIYNNRGHGVLIKSTLGKAMITKTKIMNNWGDGVKYYTVNLTTQANYEKMFKRSYFFCSLPRIGIRRYPLYVPEQVVHSQDDVAVPGCIQEFETRAGNVLTIHFVLLEADPGSIAELVISNSRYGDIIQTVPIQNGSYPQSITTISSKVYINFNLMRRGNCRYYKWCVRFLLLFSSGNSTDIELHVTESVVSENNQHGISVQDMRSKIVVNSSYVCDNEYEAGLRVFQGAGHVVVNDTLFKNNALAGVNVTYSGGLLLFNQSIFLQNKGYGLFTEFLQLNRSRIEDGLKFEVVGVKFLENSWTAFRVGNYCKGGNILVNESFFEGNIQGGIEYLSCNITSQRTNFSLALNSFKSNIKHGLLMAPLLNTVGRITNNTFVNHSLGGILINNGYDLLISRWYMPFHVSYEIFSNVFSHNNGHYAVNMRLTQNSPVQEILFMYNDLINNQINDSFPFLNPRSQANAVIVVSSSNIKVQRNKISNPASVREMSTQLIDPSVDISADYNYWGTAKYENFYNLIFDRDDRYNLAVIKYFPALKNDRLYDTFTILDPPPNLENTFIRNNVLGGELKKRLTLDAKRYRVDKDIYIEPTGWLDIPPGTVLEFDNSIGMVVYGTLVADGKQRQWVEFVLQDDFESAVENLTFPVRLEDGKDTLEGRVEVEIDGEWGTICNKGWTEQNSVIVCNQMGLIYNPRFGQAERKQKTTSLNVVMNWVACDAEDVDITKCKAQLQTDDPISCTHEDDVYLRCQLATWSGVTIPAIPKGGLIKETQIRTLKIDKAGLLDHSKMFFSPALRIDYNYYDITNVTVTSSTSDGIYIRFNHPYTNNRLQFCSVFNSLGNGLVVKYPFLETAYGRYHSNKQTGFLYDPFFTEAEVMSVLNFMRMDQVTFLEKSAEYKITSEMTLFKTRPGTYSMKETFEYKLVSLNSPLTLQILNYNPLTTVESLNISNSKKTYRIEEDLIYFPLVSPRGSFTIKLSVSGILSGRLALVVIRGGSPNMDPKIHMRNCTVSQNEVGIITKHYNNPSNDKQELYFRFQNEKIEFYFVNVQNNLKMAMHVPSVTKYHDNFIPTYEELTKPQRVGSITYQIKNSKFTDNRRGIFAEHNHVEFANNVWHWNISSSEMSRNQEGGLEIELPRVNDISDRIYHSVVLMETLFKSNSDFACKIQGYYAEVAISKNVWRNNECRLGLLDITGMEKNISISDNNFIDNLCKYVVDLDITSHFEYFDPVKGNFTFNNLKDNGLVSLTKTSDGYPSTYALAVKGLQDIVVNRNLFNNPKLQYEVIAGVVALSLSNIINVKENWWGSSDQIFIRKRIFDFDSWNSYARAEYLPFLIEGRFESRLSSEPKQEIIRNERELSGRIESNMVLFPSSTPYKVLSDVTVMPGVTLKIEPGTVLHFSPNVGILVLGTLQARGLVHNRIQMFPSPTRVAQGSSKVKRSAVPEKVRLRGGSNKNEGFLEFFNSTSNKWNIMCDNKFNEKMAEVVCRQLGFETINVRVRFSHLYDYFIYGFTTYFMKEFWAYTYQCTGDEDSMNQCTKRINYRIMACIHKEDYTFIQCGERNLESMYNYWGNIRFSLSTYQEPVWDETQELSYLEYTDIHGAGILHGKKVGAIQSVYRTPVIRHVNISGCALNGYDFIAPRHDLTIENQNISQNLGYAVNILVLNGDSRKGKDSTFFPLIESSIPYYLFGLVEICRMEREITLDTRMLLYYKYTSQAVNCVKSIRSNNRYKTIALRFLQMNLYSEDFTRNVIEIFDGQKQIAELFANSSKNEILKLYSSTVPNALTVHIHASMADREYGFIAEVVNEMFGTSSESKNKHLIKNAAMERNEDGAIQYQNVGEVNPSVYIQSCSVKSNGVSMLNMTSPPINKIWLQRSRKMVISNNFFSHNRGGTWIQLETDSLATAIEANITNNVFTYGSHGEALIVSGHYYQMVFVYGNFIFNNTAGDYKNAVLLEDVRVKFTSNYLARNTGHYILAAYAGEKIEFSQLYNKNTFKDNNSTALYESTLKVGSGMPRFVNNYLVNPDNAFELESAVITKFADGKPINATENWWGSIERWYIEGKVRDYSNNKSLTPVMYTPYKISVTTVIEGECPAGWSLDDSRCYKYFGGVQNYYDALNYCNELGGNLAESKDQELFFQKLVIESENYYNLKKRVWVYTAQSPGLCSVFLGDFVSTENDCTHLLYPFICEKDPIITANPVNLAIIISASVFSILIIVILIISAFWYFKSKQRKDQHFERRNSLRSSIRSRSQMTMLSSHPSRLNYLESRSNISDNYVIGHQTLDDASMASVEKSKYNSFITDATEVSPNSTLQHNHMKTNNNIQMIDYDDFEPSFTDDEHSIASDIQTEPDPRTHSNMDIINAVWNERSKSDDVIYSNVPFSNQDRKLSKTSLYSDVPSEPFANDQRPILSEKKILATVNEPPSPPPPLEDYKPSKRLLNLTKNINKYPVTTKPNSLESLSGQGLSKEIHPNPLPKDSYLERLAENREPSPCLSVRSRGSQDNIGDILSAVESCIPPPSRISTFPSQDSLSHTNEQPAQQYHDFDSEDLDPGIGYMQRSTFDRSSRDRIDADYLNTRSRSPYPGNLRGSRENLDLPSSPVPKSKPMVRQTVTPHSSQEYLDEDRYYQPSPRGSCDDLRDTGTRYMARPPVSHKPATAPRSRPNHPVQRIQPLETEIL